MFSQNLLGIAFTVCITYVVLEHKVTSTFLLSITPQASLPTVDICIKFKFSLCYGTLFLFD